MSGIGKYPFLALGRSDLHFGNVLVGEQVEQTVQLVNQGLVPAVFTVTQGQPASGSFTDNSIKISPSRSAFNAAMSQQCTCDLCLSHHMLTSDACCTAASLQIGSLMNDGIDVAVYTCLPEVPAIAQEHVWSGIFSVGRAKLVVLSIVFHWPIMQIRPACSSQ